MLIRLISLLITVLLVGVIFAVYLLIEGALQIKPKPYASPPPKRRSDLRLFIDGRQFFDVLQHDILHATDHIHLSFYIFRWDELGKTIINLLKEKAQSGVQVRLLLDAIGSHGLPRSVRKSIRSEGIELQFSERPKWQSLFKSINIRNHRKLGIIDGHIGYFGGFNVGDEYIGRDSRMGHWRDYHVRLTGANVADLQNCFISDWERAIGASITPNTHYFPSLQPGSSLVHIMATPETKSLEQLFVEQLEKAEKSIFIGSPYFNPTQRVMELLLQLLKRGVAITILLPAKKDHPIVKPITYHYLEPLLENGARIFHYYLGFYHAKVFIIDGKQGYLGTANFDQRSLFLNLEMNTIIDDESFIQELENETKNDLMNAIEITLDDLKKRSWIEKSKTALCYPFVPLI